MDTVYEQQLSNEEKQDNNNEKKPSLLGVFGQIFYFVIALIFINFILLVPLTLSGYIPFELFDLPYQEMLDKIGVEGFAIIKVVELAATIAAIYVVLQASQQSLYSCGFQWVGYQKSAFVGGMLGIIQLSIAFLLLVTTSHLIFEVQPFSTVPWISSIVLFAAVAVGEEVLFRGFIQNRLMTATSPVIALIISSIIFAAGHLDNDNWTYVSMLNLTLAGVTLGIFYMHTKNLWFPIMLHFTWNFVQGPILGFEVSGSTQPTLLLLTKSDNPLITGGAFGFEGSLLCTALELLAIFLIQLYFTLNKREQLANTNNKGA